MKCATCYWSGTEDYAHLALRNVRRLELCWLGEATVEYETLHDRARQAGQSLADFAKMIMRSSIGKTNRPSER